MSVRKQVVYSNGAIGDSHEGAAFRRSRREAGAPGTSTSR